ncbi:MAG: hypothetical protein L0K65_03360, partial [Actinomyces sp.]|nr:hypothetical protein [Actinomyces sp.]
LTTGGPANSTVTMAPFLINAGTTRANYGIAGAASVVLFVVAVVMAVAYQYLILRRANTSDQVGSRNRRREVTSRWVPRRHG